MQEIQVSHKEMVHSVAGGFCCVYCAAFLHVERAWRCKLKELWLAVVLFLVLLTLLGCQKELETAERENLDEKLAAADENVQGGKVLDTEKISETSELLTVEAEGVVFQRIRYEKDGQERVSAFMPELRPGLAWLVNNTPNDAIIMSWWDYGPMIEGYTGRKPVIDAPSRRLLRTVAMYQEFSDRELEQIPGDFTSETAIYDVASVLVHKYTGAATDIMDDYDADYLFITKRDIFLLYVFEYVLGGELIYDDYTDPETGQYDFPEEIQESIIFLAINDQPLPKFELVYFDGYVTIYKK